MTKTTVGRTRSILYFFLAIPLVILLTGGGRIGKVDFMSLDAWVAVSLLFAWILHRSGEPIFGPRVAGIRNELARRPYLLVGLIFTALGITHLIRFLTLGVHLFDAGFLYQGIFHAFSTPFLKCDVCHLGSYLGAHTAFTLPLLTPLVRLFGTPFIIPLLQAAIGFLTFWIIGRAYRRELGARELSFLFLALLSIRGIREGFLFDFREDLLAALFFSAGLGLIKFGRYYTALIPFILAAFSKETGAILFPFVAVSALLIERNRREEQKFNLKLAAVFLTVSLSVSSFILFYLLPSLTPDQGAGGDLVSRLTFLTADGGMAALVSQIATKGGLKYAIFTFLPLSFIVLRKLNPYYLPGFILVLGNIISMAPTQRMMQFHYDLLLIPFFGFGIAESLKTLKASGKLPRHFYTLTLLTFLAFSGTWPLSHARRYLKGSTHISDVIWTRQELAKISENNPILGDNLTFPLLTDRKEIRFLGDRVY